MRRDSFLYKTRRKAQALAHKFVSDEVMSKIYFWILLKKKLDFKNPQTFNEKLQWLKLYYYPKVPLIINCTDKFTVREYLAEKGMADRLVPLFGVWDKAEDIAWDTLPGKFVLKCNHGCAYNIVVKDKNHIDKAAVSKQLNTWLKEDFGAFNVEVHYSEIKHHRIVCEEFLGDCITDFKFFCFNGEPKFFYASTDLIHDEQASIGFFYLNGEKTPFHRNDYADIAEITLPPFYEKMLADAKALCEDFPFVRVDFFLANDRYYFSELTFTPGGCMMPFDPDQYDLELGKELDISKLMEQSTV